MNFENKFKEIEEKITKTQEELLALQKHFEMSKDFTFIFLEKCKKQGLNLVGIQDWHKDIPSSQGFPFGIQYNVFADGYDKNGWPAIWAVVSELNISGGAGNTGQHQITSDAAAKLIDGVYKLVNGKWKRL